MKKSHIALLSVFGLAAAVFGVLPQVAQRQETAAAAESLRLLQGTPPKGDSAATTCPKTKRCPPNCAAAACPN